MVLAHVHIEPVCDEAIQVSGHLLKEIRLVAFDRQHIVSSGGDRPPRDLLLAAR